MPHFTPFRIALALACSLRIGIAASGCKDAMAQHAVCEPANAAAIAAMKNDHLEGVTVVQDVATGALVVFAASQPTQLDVATKVLPLSLSKIFLAASWWDRHQPDRLEGTPPQKPVEVHEMLVGGSDSAGRQVALALRQAAGTPAVLDDLRRYGFNRSGEAFWAQVDPQWSKRLTPQPATTGLAALDDASWSSVLSIGESDMLMSPLEISRFFQAVGNNGMLCAPVARRVTKGSHPDANADCKAPTRMVEEATARKLIAAALDTVKRGSAVRIAGALQDTGWSIGGKTGTGGRAGEPMEKQDGCFAGLIFDPQGKARYSFATFVRRGGLGSGHAAAISVLLARFLAGEAGKK